MSSILYQALCIISDPSVNSNWSYSPETPNLGQIRWFFSRVTLQFDVWPWETIGLLLYATSSFVPNFVVIGEFKLELQLVRKRPIWVKIDDFFSRDLAIWPMTLKNNRAPLLFYFKLCASFHSHWQIQTWVTVLKRPIWVKIDDF